MSDLAAIGLILAAIPVALCGLAVILAPSLDCEIGEKDIYQPWEEK